MSVCVSLLVPKLNADSLENHYCTILTALPHQLFNGCFIITVICNKENQKVSQRICVFSVSQEAYLDLYLRNTILYSLNLTTVIKCFLFLFYSSVFIRLRSLLLFMEFHFRQISLAIRWLELRRIATTSPAFMHLIPPLIFEHFFMKMGILFPL